MVKTQGSKQVTGTLTSASIVPDADNTHDIGTIGAGFKDAFFDGVVTAGSVDATGNVETAADFVMTGDILPATNNTSDLGSVSLQIKDAYIAGTLYAGGKTFDEFFGAYTGLEQLNLSVTTSSASVVFASKKKYVILQNSGLNTVYVNFEAASNTNKFPLEPGEKFELYGVVLQVHAVTSASTSTLRVWGQGDSTDATPAVQVDTHAVTNSNSSTALIAGAKLITIKNTGAKIAYLNFNGAATTAHLAINPSETVNLGSNSITTLQAICGGSDTTTLRILSVARY